MARLKLRLKRAEFVLEWLDLSAMRWPDRVTRWWCHHRRVRRKPMDWLAMLEQVHP